MTQDEMDDQGPVRRATKEDAANLVSLWLRLAPANTAARDFLQALEEEEDNTKRE